RSWGGSASGSRATSDGLDAEGAAQPGLLLRGQQGDVVVLEVLQRAGDAARRAVTEGAEGAAQDVVAGVDQDVEVLRGAPAVRDPLQDLDQPACALPAGGAP